MMRYVQLDALKPNPMRDFAIDPINDDAVEKLTESINDDGFWGGVVCREKPDGTIEIAAGHHRVQAALKAGYAAADIFIKKMDDDEMIRVYARENATQRGSSGTAIAGAVVAAVRRILKVMLAGSDEEVRAILERGKDNEENSAPLRKSRASLTDLGIATARGMARSKEGLGRLVIERYLQGTGINDHDITDQLDSIKSSGHYNIIVKEVGEEIEREQEKILEDLKDKAEQALQAQEEWKRLDQEAKKAQRKADAAKNTANEKAKQLEAEKKAAEANLAAQRSAEFAPTIAKVQSAKTYVEAAQTATGNLSNEDPTFDLIGVSHHLQNSVHISAFRKKVTEEDIRLYLPVDKQAGLAAEIIKEVKRTGEELTSREIVRIIKKKVNEAVDEQRKITKEEEQERLRAAWRKSVEAACKEFKQGCDRAIGGLMKLQNLYKEKPKGETYYRSYLFHEGARLAGELAAFVRKIERM